MKQYNVTGMSCAACSARVEKAVKGVPGVESCAVSLLTNSMGVEGSADPAAVIAAVTQAGYGASLKDGSGGVRSAPQGPGADPLADTETPRLKKRLFWSLGFLLVLMYFSMGHMMWGFPLPKWFEGNHVAMGLVQLLLAALVMVINQRFFISGFRALLHRAPNMDTLVAMGSGVSFLWSVWVLFAMTRAQLDGDAAAVERYMMEFYFESAAMILTLITVGKLLEARSKGKTTDALKGLMKLAPQTAVVLRGGAETTVPVAQVQKDDIFVVRPGESIPVDGVVVEGSSAVNEAALTGESIPVDKAPGDLLSAATVNQSGFLKARATRVGEDTTLSQIIKMVSDAAATKAPIAKAADKVSGVFVPAVLAIAAVVTAIWLLLGQDLSYALGRGISVLVISCPCALGLATPVAIMVGNGVGAKNGILFKTAVSLEQTGKVKLVALDKTGTITTGRPAVTDVLPAPGVSQAELLAAAVALEEKSEHPLAKAIVACAVGAAIGRPPEADGERQQATGNRQQAAGDGRKQDDPIGGAYDSTWLTIPAITGFRALPGNGLEAVLEGKPLFGGSVKFITERLRTAGADAPAPVCHSERSEESVPSRPPQTALPSSAAAGDTGPSAPLRSAQDDKLEAVSPVLRAKADELAAVCHSERSEESVPSRPLQTASPRFAAAGDTGPSAPLRSAQDDKLEAVSPALRAKADELAAQGKTPLLFAHGDRLLGLIAVADVIKPESPAAVKELQNMGVKVVMLTGDNERTAQAIAAQAGVDQVVAGVLPEGKETVIRELQRQGPVLMVGDGINDAPALTRADVGMAIGAGADVAIDAADVVLMKSKLSDVPGALRLSRATLRNIHENLFWAFFYNCIGIPLAAGAFVKAFGWTLDPMFGAAAMSLSSFCVVTNALRLNFVKLHKEGNGQQATGNRFPRGGDSDREGGQPALPRAEDSVTTIAVKGMMCHNCERHVREALEALPGVESARADFRTGLVELRGAASEAELRQALKGAGYKFRRIVK